VTDAAKVTRRQTVHRNPWFEVEHTEAGPRDWFEVTRADSALVIAVTDDGSIVIARGPRHTTGSEAFVELPSGALEPSERAEAAARRELLEETGYSVGELRPLGWYFECPGITASKCFVFTGVVSGWSTSALEPGEHWTSGLASQKELREAVASGAVRDAGTLAALALFWNETARTAAL
jgi:ADP-ribose pyrophosphatase